MRQHDRPRLLLIVTLCLTWGLLQADQDRRIAVAAKRPATERRMALVIGNAAYRNQPPLVNTLNDARDMAVKLQSLGFEVTKVENTGEKALERAVSDFIRRVRTTTATALLYYSGHGLQVNGQNYLIPVDADIRDEWDVPNEGVPVNRVLAGLGHRGANAVNLVVLDACRNNPFKTSEQRAVGDRGLARVSAPGGTLILYATKPGKTASDNTEGRNGLFTKHLLKAMDQPGVQVENAFKHAAEQVFLASHERQDPWMEGRIRGDFYFVPAATTPVPAATAVRPPPQAPAAPGVNMELELWRFSNQCGTADCLKAYLEKYPHGQFSGLAQARLKQLDKQPMPASGRIPFTVKTTPEGAKVRILNIVPPYRDGIELEPGRYRVEVSMPGYETHLGWHVLTADTPVYAVELASVAQPQWNSDAPPFGGSAAGSRVPNPGYGSSGSLDPQLAGSWAIANTDAQGNFIVILLQINAQGQYAFQHYTNNVLVDQSAGTVSSDGSNLHTLDTDGEYETLPYQVSGNNLIITVPDEGSILMFVRQ